ncbi:Prophage tail length tape measure protein [Faunimonas pinastri]|uniref:Prophage tail length tape measure protein n=1 Tax=Faunimonas pinastri TaxID=1855383 RepID=A0A1H9F6Q1_9HYPH|nr:transglycosylase SLT domain-containing protein [Faunimonas pinastri]SEQ32958.1 Prophage tail length tape measure protein [Faunimonas pinastri]
MAASTETDRLVVQLEAQINKFEKMMSSAVATTNQRAAQIEKRFGQMEGTLAETGTGGFEKNFDAAATSADRAATRIQASFRRTRSEMTAFGKQAETGLDISKPIGASRVQVMMLQSALHHTLGSLSAGANPMTILAQQGSEVAEAFGMGSGSAGASVTSFGTLLAAMLTPANLAIAGIGVLSAGASYLASSSAHASEEAEEFTKWLDSIGTSADGASDRITKMSDAINGMPLLDTNRKIRGGQESVDGLKSQLFNPISTQLQMSGMADNPVLKPLANNLQEIIDALKNDAIPSVETFHQRLDDIVRQAPGLQKDLEVLEKIGDSLIPKQSALGLLQQHAGGSSSTGAQSARSAEKASLELLEGSQRTARIAAAETATQALKAADASLQNAGLTDYARGLAAINERFAGLIKGARGAQGAIERLKEAQAKEIAAYNKEYAAKSSPYAHSVADVPDQYRSTFLSAGDKYNVDPNLLSSVGWWETRGKFNNDAVSPAGARGIMQLMPGTASDMGVTNTSDPSQSIMAGAKYLRLLIDMFNGDIEKAVLAYNAGPAKVKAVSAGKGSFSKETLQYGPGVLTKAPGMLDQVKQQEELSKKADQVLASYSRETDAVGLQVTAVNRSNVAMETAAAKQDLENKLKAAGVTDLAAYTEKVDQLAAARANEIVAQQKQQAALKELTGRMDEVRSSAKSALSTFVSDLREGKSGAEALSDVIGGIDSKLLDLAENDVISTLFGKTGTSGGSGILTSLFSGLLGGSSTTSASVHHQGGIVGGGAPRRSVPSGVFSGAPRYHSGGIAGLKPGEMPAILKKGELVIPNLSGFRSAQQRSGGTNVNNQTALNMTVIANDAQSFRKSKTQIAGGLYKVLQGAQRAR